MLQNPDRKPNRADFHQLMSPAFYSAFSAGNIISSFRKTGIYPLNPDAVSQDAISTSQLTNKPLVSETSTSEEHSGADKILVVPAIEDNKDRKPKKRDGRAKCLTLVQEHAAKRPRGKISPYFVGLPNYNFLDCFVYVCCN